MKLFYVFLCFYFLFAVRINAQDPTLAGIPDANHVLVVYNFLSDTSLMVKNYYQTARGIPESNIVPLLNLKDQDITIDEVTHRVKIVQVTDMIQDSVNNVINPEVPTKHAFKYFLDNIATPIKTHLVNNNLLSTIRYIVLCKGIPFKIQSARDYASGYQKGDVTVDGLLCMLNTPNYDTFILNTALFSDTRLSNPYNNVDSNFTMEYRFLSDHFIAREGHHLSYLVSHLDGINFNVVKTIIDSSLNPDMSGTATWIIDDDLTWSGGHFADARNKLEELGFNVFYDYSDTWITHYPEKVIGYTSWGTHAEDGNCEWEDSAWVKDSLHFDLANGSVFNTYESFNGNSLTTLKWRYVARPNPRCHHTQGLATQFTQIGGTATMGHAWEPGGGGVVENQIFFPAYQLGYSLIDAYYQGLPNLFSNVLVGDPLVRIYECENTVITTNTTIGSGDYTCDLVVPINVTLTIEADAVVNFARNAKLKVYGTLELAEGAILNFDVYSRFDLDGNLTMSGNSAYMNFNDYSIFNAKNISVDKSLWIALNDYSKFYIKEGGTFITHPGNSFIFNNHSKSIVDGKIIVNEGNSLNFNDFASIDVNKILFNAGAEITFNEKSNINVYGTFKSLGQSSENNVTITFSGEIESKCTIYNADTIYVSNTIFNHNGLNISADTDYAIELVNINNSIFDSANYPLDITLKNATIVEPVLISSCEINNCRGTGIRITQVPEIILEFNTIHLSEALIPPKGIVLRNNGIVDINGCIITGGKVGIESKVSREDNLEIIEDLETDISISQCVFESSETGVLIDNQQAPYEAVNIHANHFSGCTYGISVNDFLKYIPYIDENILYGSTDGSAEYGMVLTNGKETIISRNSIANYLVGVNLNTVNIPRIKENFISAIDLVVDPLSGILAVSSDGEIRKNTILNHRYGIELGTSSPKIGANTITDNREYGIYISGNSNPDLSESFVGEERYPLSGYNTIRENGVCNLMNYSELYLVKSSVTLEKGCNTVADDREEPWHCGYYYLIDGEGVDDVIKANRNYWGEVNGGNPEGRFGENITVDFEGWLDDPCTYDQGETELILVDSKGQAFDTVYSTGNLASNLTDLESRYATANEYFYSNQYSQAKQEYEGIVQNYGNDRGSLQAYNRLYSIANLMNSAPETFNNLKAFYLEKAGNQSDSLMIGALTHLSDLCLVSAKEYIPAISNFDLIAQQNPNTDIALYSQIDALTTALLLPQDSTMNKRTLGKYSVNNLSDYTNKLSQLLKTRGRVGLESDKELLPTEYTLYQNYPNPFNPVTTIKYDLPNAGDVSLIIYDILGRKVKELVNTKQQAGRYEIQFNASSLASGVYIYQLIADNPSTGSGQRYINTKKTILVK